VDKRWSKKLFEVRSWTNAPKSGLLTAGAADLTPTQLAGSEDSGEHAALAVVSTGGPH
jgi:hypothetical protein